MNEWEKFGMGEEEWKNLPRGKRWRLRHPDKQKAATKNWYLKNKEQAATNARRSWLRSKYALTEKDYQYLLDQQQNQCAICKTKTPTGKWKVFAVDHCHETGIVRGLLCNECNRGMGLLRDSSELLKAAAMYLDNHKAKTLTEKKKRNADQSDN